MPTPPPDAFARHWIDGWNAHDAEAVLTHYAEDVIMTSPTAARFVPDSGGVVRGKAALREYWTVALAGNPDLRFALLDVFAGIDTIVLRYRNQVEATVSEVMTFHDGLVVVSHATHHCG